MKIKKILIKGKIKSDGMWFMKYFRYVLILPITKSFKVSFWAKIRLFIYSYMIIFLMLIYQTRTSFYSRYHYVVSNFDLSVKVLTITNWIITYVLLNTFHLLFTCYKTVLVVKCSIDIEKRISSTFLLTDNILYPFVIKQVIYLLLLIEVTLSQTVNSISLPLKIIFFIVVIKIFIMYNFFLHSQLFVFPTDVASVCLEKLKRTFDTASSENLPLAKFTVTEQILDFFIYFQQLKENINSAFCVTIILLLLGSALPIILFLFDLYITFKEAVHSEKGLIVTLSRLLNILHLLFIPFDTFCSSSRVTSQVSLLKNIFHLFIFNLCLYY